MNWLWVDRDGPRDLPGWIHFQMVVHFGVNADKLTRLKCVLQRGFEGETPVLFFRLFQPETAAAGGEIRNFADLDRCPQRIVYEGVADEKTGYVRLFPLQADC